MAKRNIKVAFDTWEQIFSDWFDFADYLKQRELKGLSTTVVGWSYCDDKGEQDHD